MKYSSLVKVYEQLEKTSKRLNKTYYISKLLEKTTVEDLDKVVLLLEGRLFPSYDERKIGIAERLVIKALAKATGKSAKEIEKKWKQIGDLGDVAKELTKSKTQSTLFSTHLTVSKVFENLRKLSELKGAGTIDKKISLMAELLTSASPLEAKYIIRTVLEDLRIGVGEGSLRDAIVWAFFPKVIGIFYKCDKCKEWNPNISKCINCEHKIENKFNKEIQNVREHKVLHAESIDDLKNLKKYKFILTKEEKIAREIYNHLINIVQEAYDKKNDFSIVAKLAKKQDIKEITTVGIEPLKPIKVMLYQKAKDLEDAFKTVGKPAACFPQNELIFSNPSVSEIQLLKKDNQVIGSNGRFQNIIKTFEREYKGELIKIFPNYLFSFSVTPEHRILVIKKKLCSWKNRNIICRPNCQEQKYGCRKNYNQYKSRWIEARNLEKGDFVLFPKFKEVKDSEKIDLIEFNKNKNIKKEENKIRSYSKLKGTFKANLINRFIELTPEFFELMGWYLAEGNSDRSGIKFSLGHKEEKEAERIKELIKIVFGINAKISKKNTVITIRGNSNLLTNFFKLNFGNIATKKRIPDFIIYSKQKKIKEFIKAYIKGDGHKSKQNVYTIVTASKNIAYQISLLLTKINILPSIGRYKNRGLGNIIYRIAIFGKQIDILEKGSHKTKTNHQRFFEDEDLFYIPIRKIESLNYAGKVFNLETEDNSYLSSAIVHNCEYKYDGFRLQIHKHDKKIKLFTRRLENVTTQFPDVVNFVKKHIKGNSFIVDAEAVGYDKSTGKYLPFQNISQRIKRKYNVESMAKDYPVELNIFDIVYYNGSSQLKIPFKERRKLLKKIVKQSKKKIILAKQIITGNLSKAKKFYEESLKAGEEGIMVKNLEGIYKPGSRVGYGVKVKPETETLDLVIVGAEWGTGKRAHWLSSFTIACKHKDKFLEIGKVGTGIKEKEGLTFGKLTKMLRPLIEKEKGKEVTIKPKIVVEIGYSEIQKSPTYDSGFALRFPRLIRLRSMEKSPKDASTLDYVKKLYKQQKK